MYRWLGAALACVFCASFPMVASATILDFTLTGEYADVSLNGGAFANEPLTITLPVNTASLSIGTGVYGSNEYTGLSAVVSSAPLGLTNVAVTTPLAVEIGTPSVSPAIVGTVVLLKAGGILNGLFGNSALASWDDVSPIGPLSESATTNGTLSLSLSNGDTLSIINFDNVSPYHLASFQASPVPEPTTLALLSAGLVGLGLIRRRSARAA